MARAGSKYHDINGNPNAKGTSILAAGAESKFPVQYAVSMQKVPPPGPLRPPLSDFLTPSGKQM